MRETKCPYAKSGTTSCVIKDGPVAFAINGDDQPICVGCEKTPLALGFKRWDKTARRRRPRPP